MPYNISRFVQNQIILLLLQGDTREEIRMVDNGLSDMLDASESVSHLIITSLAVEKRPRMQAFLKCDFPHHPNLGWIVSHQANQEVGMRSQLLSRILRLKYKQVSNLDEAAACLLAEDPTLPSDLAAQLHTHHAECYAALNAAG
jgi:hypothetical protein